MGPYSIKCHASDLRRCEELLRKEFADEANIHLFEKPGKCYSPNNMFFHEIKSEYIDALNKDNEKFGGGRSIVFVTNNGATDVHFYPYNEKFSLIMIFPGRAFERKRKRCHTLERLRAIKVVETACGCPPTPEQKICAALNKVFSKLLCFFNRR